MYVTVTESDDELTVTGNVHGELKTWVFDKRPSGVLSKPGQEFIQKHPTQNGETPVTIRETTPDSNEQWVSEDKTWEIIP